MKKSATYWMVGGFEGEVPAAEAARRAKSLGYDAIELAFGAGELTPAASESDLGAIRSEMDAVGIEVASLATGNYWGHSLSSPDASERAAALEFTKAYIKAARLLGTDTVLVVPGSVDVCWDASRPVVSARQAYDLSQQSLRSLLPLAEKEGVCLALENVWNKFLTGPFEFAAFVGSFATPLVKAYFDVGNCLINGYPEHWIEILGGLITRVHVKNFRRRGGGGALEDFTDSLRTGDADWAKVFKALHDAGYDGYVTAEVIVGAKGMPDLEQAKRVCEEMTELIEQYA